MTSAEKNHFVNFTEKVQRMQVAIRAVQRLCLCIIHFLFLACAYVGFIVQEIYARLRGRGKIALQELHAMQRIPGHIGLILDDGSDKFSAQVSDVVTFLVDVPGVSRVSLFFRPTAPKASFSSEKVRVFESGDVAPAFRTVMDSRVSLEATSYPFDEKPDLVVLYSRSSSLCNFFPWNLDLATFVLAGPPANMSPLSVVRAIGQYDRSIQRFGK